MSSTARGVAAGFQEAATFGLSSSMAGFAAGLGAYVPVDAGTATSTTVSGATTMAHAASVGDPKEIFLEGKPAFDRDGFEGGAAVGGCTSCRIQLTHSLKAVGLDP